MTSPAPLQPSDEPSAADPDERGGALPVGEMTFAEYLAFDEAAESRHEYVDGLVYPIGYGTVAHADVIANVTFGLMTAARGTGCRVYSSLTRVLTPRGNTYIPDVIADCGPRPSGASLYREHPCLVVEVLSPSTRHVDLREKLEHYRRIPTVQAYWILESTCRLVYRHWRDASGEWQSEDIGGDGVLTAPCPGGASMTLDDVYAEVDVPRDPPRRHLRRLREPEAEYEATEGTDVARVN